MTDALPEIAVEDDVKLQRSLGLWLSVLYGLGVTIGAGIYVLIAPAVARAGMQAPLAFILAALVMAPSAASFAELAARMPMSAGEAAYVRASLKSDPLARLVGLLVIATAIISAATVSRGWCCISFSAVRPNRTPPGGRNEPRICNPSRWRLAPDHVPREKAWHHPAVQETRQCLPLTTAHAVCDARR